MGPRGFGLIGFKHFWSVLKETSGSAPGRLLCIWFSSCVTYCISVREAGKGTRCRLRYLMVMPLQLQALLGVLKHCCLCRCVADMLCNLPLKCSRWLRLASSKALARHVFQAVAGQTLCDTHRSCCSTVAGCGPLGGETCKHIFWLNRKQPAAAVLSGNVGAGLRCRRLAVENAEVQGLGPGVRRRSRHSSRLADAGSIAEEPGAAVPSMPLSGGPLAPGAATSALQVTSCQ